MNIIHKFSIRLDDLHDVVEFNMPVGAKVISIGNQKETLCLWAVVGTPVKKRELRRFRVAGTGHPLDVGFPVGRFLGTAQFADGQLVFHVFDAANIPAENPPA